MQVMEQSGGWIGGGQNAPWGPGREAAAVQASDPGWLPQDSGHLLVFLDGFPDHPWPE